ncbi:MAG: leucyl aminopeptidase family protein [Bradyrhizobium sp.]|nr:MAG: leucyl aminopeptidase family protein [Bradyrhizobium sp.]
MRLPCRFAPADAASTPIWFVTPETWPGIQTAIEAGIGPSATRFAAASGFEPKPGRLQLLPDAQGALAGVLFGLAQREAKGRDPFAAGRLATALPAGNYRFANAPHDLELAALGFLLGLYRFDRYRTDAGARPQLVAPQGVDAARIEAIARAVGFGRDLVNTPANDLGPAALELEVSQLALEFGAAFEVVRGDDLIKRNLPLIHAVGRAAAEAPRLAEFRWGRADAPKVTLVGKGVVFDTGGLDIKPSANMVLMKKDMGGAATALALSRMVMETKLDVRLRTLIPIVENAISASAMRPSDVIKSRKGLTVEIGNTDAEGRLILADALALAEEEAPELLFDFATLTGAARVALGPDLPAFYADDEALAGEVAAAAARAADPLWRLPLWRPYEAMIESPIADIDNAGSGGGFAGSITAALFLSRFVDPGRAWAHFDIYDWNPKARAHGPQGGEVQAARAIFALLEARYRR